MSDYEQTLDALHATLQAIEYRVLYVVPRMWPLYECEHEWLDISTMGGPIESLCRTCGVVSR